MISDIHSHVFSDSAVVNIAPDQSFSTAGIYSVGVHPWATSDPISTALALEKLGEVAVSPQIVAIGEAGIDRLRGGDVDFQIEVFRLQIYISETLKKPMILHVVRAFDLLPEIHRESKAVQPWIIHGFRGKPELARQMIGEGFYLSLGERFNPETAAIIPADRLMVETDESALTISEIAARVAAARADGMTAADVLRISVSNISRTSIR